MAQSSVKAKNAWVLALASIAFCIVAFDAVVVTTALSAIRRDFGAPVAMLGWTVNAHNLSFAVLLLNGTALLAIGACAALSFAGAIAGRWLPARAVIPLHGGSPKHDSSVQMADLITSRPGIACAKQCERNTFSVAVVARFETRPGTDAEIQDFFSRGHAIVEQQPASTMWIAYRIGPTSFGAFAAFASEVDRDALLTAGGPKMSREFAGLFAASPTFEKADVLVARLAAAPPGDAALSRPVLGARSGSS